MEKENEGAEGGWQKVKGKSVENNEGDDQSMGVAFSNAFIFLLFSISTTSLSV